MKTTTEQMNFDEIKKFISDCSPKTSVYIGTDSQRYKKGNKWFASYSRVVVVHIDSKHGCKIFGDIQKLPDFGSIRQRLMQEVQLTIQVFDELIDELIDKHFEIHLDVNPDPSAGSNSVVKEAIGYVRGVTGVEPKIKPDALAASYAADAGVRGRFSG